MAGPGDLATRLAAGDWPGAERMLRRAAARADAGPSVFYNLGKVLLEQGKAAQAATWLARTLATDPAHPGAPFELGRALLAAGDLAGAQGAFARALARDPADADAARTLGRIAERRGDWAAATDAWERVAALIPGDGEALVGRTTAAAETGAATAGALRASLLARPDLRPVALAAFARAGRGSLPLTLPPHTPPPPSGTKQPDGV